MWILLIVYKAGLVDHFTFSNSTSFVDDHTAYTFSSSHHEGAASAHHSLAENGMLGMRDWIMGGVNEEQQIQNILQHKDTKLWTQLSPMHWPTLLGYYNITLLGKSVLFTVADGIEAWSKTVFKYLFGNHSPSFA